MGKVIGYKDTPEDRKAYWVSMVDLRRSPEVFGNSTDPQELEVLERDKELFSIFLSRYIAA